METCMKLCYHFELTQYCQDIGTCIQNYVSTRIGMKMNKMK
jgi:hypothetical protein